MTEWLPKFTHRYVGPFVVFQWIAWEDVAGSGFVVGIHPERMGIADHTLEEDIDEKVVLSPTPVGKEGAGRIGIVDDVTKQGGQPVCQFVTGNPLEFCFHARSPCLCPTFPAV